MKKYLKNNILKVGILAIVLFVQACITVPLIGRKKVSLLPESSMVEMSLTSYDQLRSKRSYWDLGAHGCKFGAKQSEFLSTHPIEQNRIEAIKQFLPGR